MQEALTRLLAGRRGHFHMESGYHSDAWFELDRLWENPAQLAPCVRELARRLDAHHPDAICGPMTGGAKLATAIAAELDVDCFHTERFAPPDATGLYPVKYRLPPDRIAHARGRRLAVVDDAISAGSAVRGTGESLAEAGSELVTLGALVVFGDKADLFAAEKNLPLEALARVSFNLWRPEECPLCAAGRPLECVSDAARPGPPTVHPS